MDRPARIARNLSIAEKYYDGYHGSVSRGRLAHVFDPVDFAPEWIFCSPYLGGETAQGQGTSLAEGAVANHDTIWRKIPDYKMDDLRAWPTEAGCAWRWCVNGHGLDGRELRFWEQLFIWTDDAGRITRFEFYDDWHGFAPTLTYAYDLTLDEFSRIEGYGSPPWTPGTTPTIGPPADLPHPDPPATDTARRNLATAEQCFDNYRCAPEVNWLETLAHNDQLAADCVVFSPWTGERPASLDPGSWTFLAVGHEKIRRRLPDYGVSHFDGWPTDTGCAWRWKVAGHAADGTAYELWQQVFTEMDAGGRITRLESYFDWQGFPQMMGYLSGLPLDELWHPENYRRWLDS